MSKGTLLLVDNNLEFLKTRAELLEKEGYRVRTASSPAEAKRLLAENRPDLLVTDIRLENDNEEHDSTGLSLAREVSSEIPKIIWTGHPTVNYVREAYRDIGAIDFVGKEEETADLLKAIRKAILRNVVVIGGDKAARQRVARFAEKLEFRPIVLQNSPKRSQTISQQFAASTNLAFTILILTPEDSDADQNAPDSPLEAQSNFLTELGSLAGKLEKESARLLYTEGTKIPRMLRRIPRYPMDRSNGWQLALARDMRAAGLDIDLNALI